jgi:23S rRNA (adenine-N6)-dimethyltransferase
VAVRARHSARGQHFLRSSALAAEIVRAAGIRPGDLVLDLGAGTGVLTRALVRAGARVVAVELDPELARGLRARFPNVMEDDILRVPLPRRPFRVVANLPFDCTTAVLRRLLDPLVPLRSADVIVQWEFATKRAAVWPSTRLGVQWGAWHELSLIRRLPRCCFAPQPSVDCAVLRATRRDDPLLPVTESGRYARFVDRGFRNGLRAVVPTRQLKLLSTELGFGRTAAPRDLDARQWAMLYRRAVRPTG